MMKLFKYMALNAVEVGTPWKAHASSRLDVGQCWICSTYLFQDFVSFNLVLDSLEIWRSARLLYAKENCLGFPVWEVVPNLQRIVIPSTLTDKVKLSHISNRIVYCQYYAEIIPQANFQWSKQDLQIMSNKSVWRLASKCYNTIGQVRKIELDDHQHGPILEHLIRPL